VSTRPPFRRLSSAFCISVLATSPCWGLALDPGDNQQNPQLVTQPPNYTSGLPAWYDLTPQALINPAIQPPTLGTPFIGNVRSEVYYLNGVNASDGLGFAYTFFLSDTYTADGLESASFSPATWGQFALAGDIADTGSNNGGVSTAVAPPPFPPAGFTSWSDGDPYTIKRDANTKAPELRWTGTLGGTEIRGGQRSAIIWFEVPRARLWSEGIVTLLDGGVGGSAFVLTPVLPEPMTAMLFGLGAVAFMRRRRA
jgi:hypothetical protein